MSLTKSAKRRMQRKTKLSRIREESVPQPKSLEEIQAMILDTEARIEAVNRSLGIYDVQRQIYDTAKAPVV